MNLQIQITFRDMAAIDSVEERIRERASKLQRYYDRITGCKVVVAAPHRHQHKGNLYSVRIDLAVPGGEVVVNHEPSDKQSHQDVFVAIRDAFDAAERQLEAFASKRRDRRVG